jgi:hypothetical protein
MKNSEQVVSVPRYTRNVRQARRDGVEFEVVPCGRNAARVVVGNKIDSRIIFYRAEKGVRS